MTKILILSKIDSEARAALVRRHDVVVAVNPSAAQLPALVADREVIVLRSGVDLTSSALDHGRHLALLLRAGSGTDNIDVAYLARRGIKVVRVPGPGAQSVAELTFAHMLALARRLVTADGSMRAGLWLKAELEGRTLAGKTLGVIGLGNIGTRVAQMGVAWGMQAVGCVDKPSPARAREFAGQGVRLMSCEDVLRTADYVSVHVPLIDRTRNLIGRDQLKLMKPDAYLVNVARGGVVDEDALLESLEAGRLAGAGIDVHVHENDGQVSPLAQLPNVTLTPHLGASTLDSQREIGREVVRIIDAFHTEREAPAPTVLSPATLR